MADTIDLGCELTIDGKAYVVLHVELREALDEIPELRCELTDRAGGPAPAALVGKKAELTLSHLSGPQERKLAGLVVEAESTTARGDEGGEQGTSVVVRPRLFRLTQRSDCRTFQDQSVQDIVKKVLSGAGLADTDQKWSLGKSYPKRTYTAQYRESDHEFLQRVLSEEGIAYAVDSSSGTDVVVFFDGDLGDVEGDMKIPFGLGDGLNTGRDAIGGLSHEKSTAPGKVHLRDYDFEHPRLGLDARAEGDDAGEKALEVYAYPGRFTDPAIGDRYARVLLDSLRARRELVRGTTSTLRLHPGRRFQLDAHPYEPLNQEYLVLQVDTVFEARRLEARREDRPRGARVEFRAIPS
jgi:type VI secretion system secreted protein VgrG